MSVENLLQSNLVIFRTEYVFLHSGLKYFITIFTSPFNISKGNITSAVPLLPPSSLSVCIHIFISISLYLQTP